MSKRRFPLLQNLSSKEEEQEELFNPNKTLKFGDGSESQESDSELEDLPEFSRKISENIAFSEETLRTLSQQFVDTLKEKKVKVVSFDFDETLTKVHTHYDKKYKEKHQIVQESTEELQKWFPNFAFTRQLFQDLIKSEIIVTISTKQHEEIVSQILNKSELLSDEELKNITINKCDNKNKVLEAKFPDKKIIHFDDDEDEINEFKSSKIQAIKVEEKGGIGPDQIKKLIEKIVEPSKMASNPSISEKTKERQQN